MQGDVTHIYNSVDRKLAVCYTYDAWGNHIALDENDTVIYDSSISITAGYENHVGNLNPFRYRGYYYDIETGLYFLQSRYYDPQVGRFISADDISVLDVTKEYSNGLNLYAYCFNNPVNAADHGGDMPNWLKWLIGGLAFVSAVALTALTGGALAPVFTGMAISIIAGGVIDGLVTMASGGSFSEGFWNGAADGALWGGVFALGGSLIRTARLFKNGVVIGENMTRVSGAAKHIGAVTYKSPGQGSGSLIFL